MLLASVRKKIVILLLLLPVLLALGYILAFGVDVPVGDQWEFVRLLEKDIAGELNLSDLWEQHNEHRILVPYVIFLALAHATRYNVVVEMLVGYLLLAATAVLVVLKVVRKASSNEAALFGLLPVPYLMLNWKQGENLLWGFQLSFILPLFLAVFCYFILDSGRREIVNLSPLRFLAALALALLASFSSLMGLTVWFGGLFSVVAASKGRRRAIALTGWSAMGAMTFCLYFAGYERPVHHPSVLYFIHDPAGPVRYGLTILGGALADPFPSLALGMIVLLWIGVLFWDLARGPGFREYSFFASSAVFCLLTLGAITAGRSGFGYEQALSGRYTTYSLCLIALLYAMSLLRCLAQPHRKDRWIAMGLVLLVILSSYLDGFAYGRRTAGRRREGKRALETYQEANAVDLERLYPKPEEVRQMAETLETLRYSVFRNK